MMTVDHIQEETRAIPEVVTAVFNHFLTCELTTIGKSGLPITWPIMPIYWAQRGQFVIFTSIGLPQKAYNVRHQPRVSLLFSDPTGSDLINPPTVLVQGEARVSAKIIAAFDGLEPDLLDLVKVQARKMVERQPAMKLYTKNPLTRYLMDWYFMRLIITVQPHQIQWWSKDKSSADGCLRLPQMVEVHNVV